MPDTSVLVAAGYLLASLLTYAIYAKDKHAARQGGRRVPERTLHLLALLGGWPGALIALQRLRHKTRKTGFLLVLVLTVVLNLAGLLLLYR
ncbi:MAG: DUF1294 domain-containing protein [Burkholderiales bacterium]|nr:DUF1294 domain-containing protein [Burkholderiales bacterium]